MSQHILLAVALQHWKEFSPHALIARDVAVRLAKGFGGKLSVLSAYDYEDLDVPGLAAEELGRYRDTQMQRIDALMEQKLKTFLDGVPTNDLSVIPLLKVGKPRQLIIRTAESLGTDLIVIGAHSKRNFLDVLLGGTAAYVSRHAPCPVVMVQPRPRDLGRTSMTA
jgi:nucleotide-binding universal stress UspA family protein